MAETEVMANRLTLASQVSVGPHVRHCGRGTGSVRKTAPSE